MKYYEVCAKCGHVGKGKYYPGKIYILAEDGKQAAEKARNFPRVKHDKKDAIISVKEISEQEYLLGKQAVNEDPFWSCTNKQQQNELCPDIAEKVFMESSYKTESIKRPKRHSLRKIYNYTDPLYEEYINYSGNIRMQEESI